MFKLQQKNKLLQDKVDFKFSNFSASKVPIGYDKLVVCIVAADTGKTIAKTNKSLVRSGTCQWHEAVSESVKFVHDDITNDADEKPIKFIVSMGSARVGILGEATINLTDYLSSKTPASISLPLKKCNQGTILHVRIQCMSPRMLNRASEQAKDNTSEHEDQSSLSDDADMRSEGSDSLYSASFGSSSGRNLVSGLQQSKDGTSSPAYSQYSSGSADVMSLQANITNGNTRYSFSHGSSQDSFRSSPSSSFNTKSTAPVHKHWQERLAHGSHGNTEIPKSGMRSSGSAKSIEHAKSIFETVDITTQQLNKEAAMWEKSARKLGAEVEMLKHQISELTKENSNLKMEYSATKAEKESLNIEIEQLTTVLNASTDQGHSLIKARFEADDAKRSMKELNEELEIQKQSNIDLDMQLRKTQDANAELLSAVEELENQLAVVKVEAESFKSSANGQEADVTQLQKEKENLMRKLEAAEEENTNSRSQLRELDQDLSRLKAIIESELSSKEIIEKKAMDLERRKNDLESCMTKLKTECMQLTERTSGLEAQLKYVTEEREFSKKENCMLQAKVDALMKEHDAYIEREQRFRSSEQSLSKSQLDNAATIEHLRDEIKHLTEQMSSTCDEKEKMATEALVEASKLRSENIKLENALREIRDNSEGTYKLVENMKQSEESFRERIQDLEKTLRNVDEENKKLKEESIVLSSRNNELGYLKSELTSLRTLIEDVKTEKSLLESSLRSKDLESEKILSENMMLLKQLESKAVMEEEIIRMKAEFTARDESIAQETEQKNELARLKRLNDQYQGKLQDLEEEREELRSQVDSLGEELKNKRERSRSARNTDIGTYQTEIKNLRETNKRLQTLLARFKETAKASDLVEKVVFLETELAEATEANAMYKEQLQTFLSQDQSVQLAALQSYGAVDQVLSDLGKYRQTISALEADLKDMRERYFRMSLQFAEVEAQREELVMSVKSLKGGRRWF